MSIRSDLEHDDHRCPWCRAPLAEASDLRRVVLGGDVDLLVICSVCHGPSVIPWVREAA